MKLPDFFEFINIDEYSSTPKYLQLSNAIISAAEAGKLAKESLLPSINELSFKLEISRDTAERGYKHLKAMGTIKSVPGKGNYLSNINFAPKLKVFLLFNKLSAHKKIIYDSFISELGDDALVDFYIYNNDLSIFKRFLNNRREDYSHYVLIPHFIEGEEFAKDLINTIPKEKLVLVDKKISGVDGEYASAFENFEKNIYDALEEAREHLIKYHTLKIIFPERSYYPKEILEGFLRFCGQYAFSHKIVSDISVETIGKGEVFINLMEDDLVLLLERVFDMKYKIGKDVGIISYNETPLKKILLDGITTISTDFKFMGTVAAQLVLDNSRRHVEVPFYFIKRASI